jgi:hypothetical protein
MIIETTDTIHDLVDLFDAAYALQTAADAPMSAVKINRPFKLKLHQHALSDGSLVYDVSLVFIGEE